MFGLPVADNCTIYRQNNRLIYLWLSKITTAFRVRDYHAVLRERPEKLGFGAIRGIYLMWGTILEPCNMV
jgi:hypothetical protein